MAGTTISVTADIFNVLNWQAVTSRDEVYTNQNVDPTQGFQVANLNQLTDDEGTTVTKRDDFGKANGWQAPRVFRFGLRGEF